MRAPPLLGLFLLFAMGCANRPNVGPPVEALPEGEGESDGGTELLNASWERRVLYFAMTDRFFNGDTGNDRAGFPECFDPAHPKRFHGGDFKGLREKVGYL